MGKADVTNNPEYFILSRLQQIKTILKKSKAALIQLIGFFKFQILTISSFRIDFNQFCWQS